jgi:hypothetical protein
MCPFPATARLGSPEIVINIDVFPPFVYKIFTLWNSYWTPLSVGGQAPPALHPMITLSMLKNASNTGVESKIVSRKALRRHAFSAANSK